MRSVVLVLSLVRFGASTDAVSECALLGDAPPTKPFPSLTQCYKQNQDACCVSAHDAEIQGDYGSLLSDTCVREYQDLEHYFCLGCNPQQQSYVQDYCDSNTEPAGNSAAAHPCITRSTSDYTKFPDKKGKINVCSTFKDSLLYGEIEKAFIDKYDNCGLMLPTSVVISCPNKDGEKVVKNGITYGGDGKMGAFPSKYFKDNAKAEIRACYYAKTNSDTEYAGIFAAINGCGADFVAVNACPDYAINDWDVDDEVTKRAENIFFRLVRPTYFGTDDYDLSYDPTDATTCFSAGQSLIVSLPMLALTALLTQLLTTAVRQ